MTTISVDPNLDRAQRKVSTTNLNNFAGVDCQLLVVKETHRPVVMDGKTPGGVFESASLKELNAVKTELTEAIGTKQPTGNYLTKEDAASTYVKKTDKVTSASTADKATQADSATNATNAATADAAVKATQDGSGNVIVTTYATKTELAGKADTAHTHETSEVKGLDTALAGKSDTGHSHSIADVTELQTTLDGKAPSAHTHSTADVSGLDEALAGKSDSSHNHDSAYIKIAGARGKTAGYELLNLTSGSNITLGYLTEDHIVVDAQNATAITVNIDGANLGELGIASSVKILRFYNTVSTTSITFNPVNGIKNVDFFGEDAPSLSGKATIHIVADFHGENVSLRVTQY